jgi:hypothetical protein
MVYNDVDEYDDDECTFHKPPQIKICPNEV